MEKKQKEKKTFNLSFVVCPRSKSLALHAVRSRSINSDTGEDAEGAELITDNTFSNTLPNQHSENREVSSTERKPTSDGPLPVNAPLDREVKEAEKGQSRENDGEKVEQEETDRLFIHLRDNMETIREFCKDMVQQIPIPELCVIEGKVNMGPRVEILIGNQYSRTELLYVHIFLHTGHCFVIINGKTY